MERPILKLPLSKLRTVPLCLQNRALSEGEKRAKRCREKGMKRGGQPRGQKGKKDAWKQIRSHLFDTTCVFTTRQRVNSKVPEGHHPRCTTLSEALRGNLPLRRLCGALSEGSAGVSPRVLQGSAGFCKGPRDFPRLSGVVTLCL